MSCIESGTLNLSMYFVPVRDIETGKGERDQFHEVEKKKSGS